MTIQKEISIKEIKEKIKRSLREEINKPEALNLLRNANIYRSAAPSPSSPASFIKRKIIKHGLKNKNLFKRIPLLNAFASRMYHSMRGNTPESSRSPTMNKKSMALFERIKLVYRKIVVLGFLTWWTYMS